METKDLGVENQRPIHNQEFFAYNSDLIFILGHFRNSPISPIPQNHHFVKYKDKNLHCIMLGRNTQSPWGTFREVNHVALVTEHTELVIRSESYWQLASSLISLLKIIGQKQLKALVVEAWTDNRDFLDFSKKYFFEHKEVGDIQFPEDLDLDQLNSQLNCKANSYSLSIQNPKKLISCPFNLSLDALLPRTDKIVTMSMNMRLSKLANIGSLGIKMSGLEQFFDPVFYMLANAQKIGYLKI